MVSIYTDGLRICSIEMRVKGVKYYRNRHGKWYAYHRKTGRRIRAEPCTAAFLAGLAMVRAYTEEADEKGRAVAAIARLDFAKT